MFVRMFVSGLAVCCFALLALAPTASGECCYPEFKSGKCADGSLPEGVYCGRRVYGGCNLFGCDCEGGCIRRQKRLGRSAANAEQGSATTGVEIVQDADTDGNGALDGVEIAVYFHRQGLPLEGRDWRALDANQDGQLSPHEVDSDLEPVSA